MVPWVNNWDLGGSFDEATHREYLRWFHGATHIHCFPVPIEAAPHEAEITDTFAMEPLAAFHALVSKFLTYVVLSLLCK
jgi:hypothetical protein